MDKSTIIYLLKKKEISLNYLSAVLPANEFKSLQSDKDVVLAAVSNHGWSLGDASDDLKDDKFLLALMDKVLNAIVK